MFDAGIIIKCACCGDNQEGLSSENPKNCEDGQSDTGNKQIDYYDTNGEKVTWVLRYGL